MPSGLLLTLFYAKIRLEIRFGVPSTGGITASALVGFLLCFIAFRLRFLGFIFKLFHLGHRLSRFVKWRLCDRAGWLCCVWVCIWRHCSCQTNRFHFIYRCKSLQNNNILVIEMYPMHFCLKIHYSRTSFLGIIFLKCWFSQSKINRQFVLCNGIILLKWKALSPGLTPRGFRVTQLVK